MNTPQLVYECSHCSHLCDQQGNWIDVLPALYEVVKKSDFECGFCFFGVTHE